MIIITKELMQAIDACPIGPNFFTTMNLWGLEEKVVLERMAEANMVAERDWWLQTKATAVGMEAIKAHCDPNYYTLGGFRVCALNGEKAATCATLNEALALAEQKLSQIVNAQENLFHVNHASANASGDATWKLVDLEATLFLDGFQVFNPMTGTYINNLTASEARSKLMEIKQQWCNLNHSSVYIEQEMIGVDGAKAWRRIFW